MDDLPELRADVPALEPDPVLLGQLVELSAASAAADTAARTRLHPVRALLVGAAALGLVAATSWIAGALPGVPSPIAPEQAPPPAPTAPANPHRTGDVRVPSASAGPTSGASSPHAEAPGVVPPAHDHGTGRPDRPSAGPSEHGGRGGHTGHTGRGGHTGHTGRGVRGGGRGDHGDRGHRGDRSTGSGRHEHPRGEQHADGSRSAEPRPPGGGPSEGQQPPATSPSHGHHTGRPTSDPSTGP